MSLTELEAVAIRIEEALAPEDLFGPPLDSESAQRDAVAVTYRAAVKAVHPDHFVGTLAADRAGRVFRKLTELKTQALAKIGAGTYGKRDVPAPADAPPAPVVVKTKDRVYVVGDRFAQGDYADLYKCTWDESGREAAGVFKIVRSPADNDLAENEAAMLVKAFPKKEEELGGFRILPKLLDTFELRGKGSRRRVVVLPGYHEHVSFAEIGTQFASGIDFRDAIWMFKRVLYGIGQAHRMGVVHGGVLPPHVLVHPTEHGARLIDWSGAAPTGGKVRSASPAWKYLYAPEILRKEPVSPATDIYMAAATCAALLGADSKHALASVPSEIRGFLGTCLVSAPSRRPDDAWALHEDFDVLLKRVVGKPKYRPFRMPEGAKAGEK